MATTHRLHLGHPILRPGLPRLPRHDLSLPLAAALAMALLLAVLALPQAVALARATVAPAVQTVLELADRADARGRNLYPRPTVSFEHMYAPGVKAPSVEHMYARPRPMYFDPIDQAAVPGRIAAQRRDGPRSP